MYDVYSNACNDLCRFSLGKSGKRKLLTIGLNPSKATKEKSDTTVAKVEEVAKRNGFDGFVMINLYPVRSANFRTLPMQVDVDVFVENLKRIEDIVALEPEPVIWAAWGESILARKYFVTASLELFEQLKKYRPLWQHFGALTVSGHPRHPSRLRYAWTFDRFDTSRYAQRLGI